MASLAETDVEALLEVEEGSVEGEEVTRLPTGAKGKARRAEGVEDGCETLADIEALFGRKLLFMTEEETIAPKEVLPADDLVVLDDVGGDTFVLETQEQVEVGIDKVEATDAELRCLCRRMTIVEINTLAGAHLAAMKIVEMSSVLIAIKAAGSVVGVVPMERCACDIKTMQLPSVETLFASLEAIECTAREQFGR